MIKYEDMPVVKKFLSNLNQGRLDGFGHAYEEILFHKGQKHQICVPRADVCFQWNARGEKSSLGVVVFSPFSEVSGLLCKRD